jgi:thiol-disulfide isomerase/thioredoxin
MIHLFRPRRILKRKLNTPKMTPQPPDNTTASTKPWRRRGLIAAALIAGAIAGWAGIYGIGALKRNAAGDPACRGAVATAQKLGPLNRGEVAALTLATAPMRLPDLAFRDTAGTERKLSDFRGRTVLLNLWATWCVPCRQEMPALDTLQSKLGGDTFEVVAVNIDTRDTDKPKAWLKDAGIARLGYYHDSNARIFQDLKMINRAFGMPTSVLIDPQGCEIASLAGPAEWASDDALKLIGAAVGR